MADAINFRVGTYRAADPAQTWERIRPMLPRFGITRVADITRLDDIGLPVHVAYRPTSLTFAVSIGTGATVAQSRVSAVMESIEAWHAENLRLPVAARAPAAALDLPYDVRDLELAVNSPLTADVTLDWVAGHGLLTGREILVPEDCVRLDGTTSRDWAKVFFWPTSNGLATGNTLADAALHGLNEVIERESVTAYQNTPDATWRYVDPATSPSPLTQRVYAALRAAGCTVVTCEITGPVGLPTYAATIWYQDVPMRCGGYGCHADPGIALGRAMGEAVLSRLAAISGARDDIDGSSYEEMKPLTEPAELASCAGDVPWADTGDLESVIRHGAERVAAVTGCEPFAVRLDHDDVGIPAVKVVAPGLRMMDAHRPRLAGSEPPAPAAAREKFDG
jgi:ribosomal protein S12 methylthiotransferase accessory factor